MTWHAGAACHPDRKPAHMTAQEWNRTWFPNPNAPVDGVAARDAAQDAGWAVRRNHGGRDLCPGCRP